MGFRHAGWKQQTFLAAMALAAGVGTVASAAADQPAGQLSAPVQGEPARSVPVHAVQFSGQRGPNLTTPPPPAMPTPGQRRPAANQPMSKGRAIVLGAFEKTKMATGEADYTEIIDRCHEGLEAGLDGAMTVYANRLMAWALNRRGESRSEGADQDSALEDFETAIAIDGSKWRYIHNRGVSHATLGHYEKAIADFNQTLKLNPKYANAYFNRGELRYEERDFAGAIADYTEAIKLSPRDATAYNSRGHAHYRLREFREALADYHQAVRLDPNNAAAFTNRGDMYADFGNWANATSDYRSAIKLNPNLGRAYQSAAWLLATCPEDAFRSADGAMKAAAKALELDGEGDYRYLETLAAAEANAGYFGDAIDTQKGAVAMVPDDFRHAAESRLRLYQQKQPYREAPHNTAPTTASRKK